jgi:hypothetical protein
VTPICRLSSRTDQLPRMHSSEILPEDTIMQYADRQLQVSTSLDK